MNNFKTINIMRLSQSIKHIFVIPELFLGIILQKNYLNYINLSFINFYNFDASSNYIMNEICDRHYDIHHEL